MLPAGVIEPVDHVHGTVYVARTKDQIKHAPEYHDDRRDDASYHELGEYYAGHHT